MERRNFMRLSTVGLVAGIVAPKLVSANTYKPYKGPRTLDNIVKMKVMETVIIYAF